MASSRNVRHLARNSSMAEFVNDRTAMPLRGLTPVPSLGRVNNRTGLSPARAGLNEGFAPDVRRRRAAAALAHSSGHREDGLRNSPAR